MDYVSTDSFPAVEHMDLSKSNESQKKHELISVLDIEATEKHELMSADEAARLIGTCFLQVNTGSPNKPKEACESSLCEDGSGGVPELASFLFKPDNPFHKWGYSPEDLKLGERDADTLLSIRCAFCFVLTFVLASASWCSARSRRKTIN